MGINDKVMVAIIFGGLGNQLFIYAAAKRLAPYNSVPLKLDITTGFEGDAFKRKYSLEGFHYLLWILRLNRKTFGYGLAAGDAR